MCGIIAVLQRRPDGDVPDVDALITALEAVAQRSLAEPGDLHAAADELERIDGELRGPLGVAALLEDLGAADRIVAATAAFDAPVARLEGELERSVGDVEALNVALLRLKDVVWALGHDRVDTARGVAGLMGEMAQRPLSAVCAYWAIEVALVGLDRLEVRGRDSAGINVLVAGHGLDPDDPALAERARDPLYQALAVGPAGETVSFVYKVAAEIGELGDNTAALRAQIRADEALRRALLAPDALATVLGHTRWASVGVISEANAHPLRTNGSFAAINGDVDNYRELEAAAGVTFPAEITTDSKVVPALVDAGLSAGDGLDATFAGIVADCEGSAAIALSTAADPDRLHLALRGSGQALYVGLAGDAFVIASEPYGVVQETASYVPMSSEGRSGQMLVLDRAGAGTLDGLHVLGEDGSITDVDPGVVRQAEIGPRDIDRGDYAHFLLKEISESPLSFRKTLRGKIEDGDQLRVRLGADTLPERVIAKLPSITEILVVAQGTAAVAGQSVANAIATALGGRQIAVSAMLATELSGFHLADDMSRTLIIAVSQSGTTTDTNRTVDLVRARGAAVVAIVNRRNSDLVSKSDGVLYTSDGRDVEMSVASTKAFYAQVAAGWMLALALAQELGVDDARTTDRLLRGLRALPDALTEVLAARPVIAAAASAQAPSRRHWAVVGNGPNRVAAEEVRIKLSELCYHAIACDGTEDKKHIDLSSEPLIFVCAAGLVGPNADDVSKEVAIFRAHKAAPIVIATQGEGERFSAALHVIEVPAVEPELGFVLSAMAGHLFGYEAALAIDDAALPLREVRVEIDRAIEGGVPELERLGAALLEPAGRFFATLREGRYNGNLEANTAVRVAGLLRYAAGLLPVEGYELDFGKVGTPESIVADLADAVSTAVAELTRPVDAIKHQAKTVTVGISRSEEALLGAPLVRATLDAGTPPEALSYRAMRALAALGPFAAEVTGFTRYAIEGDVDEGARIGVVGRGGVALELTSRTDRDDRLLGAKHRAAVEREVTVAVGARDQRTLVLVPEVVGGVVTGMTLLHVAPVESLPAEEMRGVLTDYRGRYTALQDAVTETQPTFDDAVLGEVAPVELLTAPVFVLARRWAGSR